MAEVTLTADATRAELLRAYRENSDYDLVDSLSKARTFITAARMLLAVPVRRTAVGSRGGEEVELDLRIVSEEKERAERWYGQKTCRDADPVQLGVDPDWRC